MTVKQRFKWHGMKVPVDVWTHNVAHNSLQQLANIASLPIVHHKVAAMPDVHLGKGATVGSVIATHKAIIPAAVGVDIGCGMCAVRLSLNANDLPDSLKQIRLDIEDAVPLGAGQQHDREMITAGHDITMRFDNVLQKHDVLRNKIKWTKFANQIGTLGSGNHFIELCLDENDDVWVMLHSGSRGTGNMIGSYFIRKAKEDMKASGHFDQLPDKDLAYLSEGTVNYDDYIEAVGVMQDYARFNRDVMLRLVLDVLRDHLPPFVLTKEAINCHHNYVEREFHFGEHVWVTRKGAIRAGESDLGIIPGSMGTRSYIVRGRGSEESFCSCSHGAGRVHSRKAAHELFTTQDLKDQTYGVECRVEKRFVDEIPAAYKDIDEVMDNQKDLVEVLHTLRQVVNVKG